MRRLSTLSTYLFVVVLLLVPAFWNRYPLIYFDTEDYVNMSFTFDLIIWRTMPYAVLTAIARPFGTLVVVLIVQAVVVAWVLHESVAAFTDRRPQLTFAALALMLALVTGLPWYVSQILPDAFAGIAPLAIAVLAFGTGLPWPRRLLLVPIIAVAIAVHMSHVAVAAGLLVCLSLLWILARAGARWPRPRMGLVAAAVLMGIALVPLVHKLATGEAFFSRSGRVLQLALFVQDGLAQRALNDLCPQGATFRLCSFRHQLPATADKFLWAPWESPVEELGGWEGLKDEADALVGTIIARYPWPVAQAALRNTLLQLSMVRVGEGLDPKVRGDWSIDFVTIAGPRYPADVDAFRHARQQEGAGIDFGPLNLVQVPIAFLAQFGLLALLFVAWKRDDRDGAGLALTLALALLGNAFVCGALSNPHDRYQGRIVWIAVVGCTMLTLRWLEARRHRAAAPAASYSPQAAAGG